MQLSQKCQYAVRALLELAKIDASQTLKIGDIAQRQLIPQRFLENILNQLKGLGFVASVRGKDGGYRLAQPSDKIFLGDIIRAVEGSLEPVPCLDGKGKICQHTSETCVLKDVWQEAEQAIASVYDNISFADLAKKAEKLNTFNNIDFCI